MSAPYVSSRSGRFQWMMQRVSAVLLLFLTFSHFGLQHFTAEAVSTGLTVTNRMNDPFWQGYYIMFILLAMYHGINGVYGIFLDYGPKPMTRRLIAISLWTLAGFFTVLGLTNIVNPKTVPEVKVWYAENGFAEGATHGNPPFGLKKSYDLQTEEASLSMFAFYAEHHVAGAPASVDIIGDNKGRSGELFDAWIVQQLSGDVPSVSERDRDYLFSSSYEFAAWAAQVRLRNAGHEAKSEDPAAQEQAAGITARLQAAAAASPFLPELF